MAKKLRAFPGEGSSNERRYPWHEWADGSVWEIRHREDYDVSTENMRVNLHIKAGSLMRKVRTRKVHDTEGEGLIFQFLESEDTLKVRDAMEEHADSTNAAIKQLYADALEIYERARHEVEIERSDGGTQKYAAVRFRQQIERGYADGMLVPTVASIVRKRTTGFGHLERAGRIDLMLETLVVDTSKPYHRLFTTKTVETARTRLDQLQGPA